MILQPLVLITVEIVRKYALPLANARQKEYNIYVTIIWDGIGLI